MKILLLMTLQVMDRRRSRAIKRVSLGPIIAREGRRFRKPKLEAAVKPQLSVNSGRVQFLTDRSHSINGDQSSTADETLCHVLDISVAGFH
jgi:hypothetical protein